MATPDPRTPICIARGNLTDLRASIADLEEGEICYAVDQNAHYQKSGVELIRVAGGPEGSEWDIMQHLGGKWVGLDQVNGGNFAWLLLLPLCAYLTQA